MKPPLSSLLSHGGALLAGIALAAAMITRPAKEGASSIAGSVAVRSVSQRQGLGGVEGMPPDIAAMDENALRNLSPKDYRAAWKAIARKKVPVKERIRLQREILMLWAKKDLKGALQAAYDGQWDGGDVEGGIDALVSAFQPAFHAEPLEAWQILHSDDFVLASKLFESDWLEAASGNKPEIVAGLIREMTPELAGDAVEMLAAPDMSPALRSSLLDAIASMPGYRDVSEMLNRIMEESPSTGVPETLRAKLLSTTREPARTVAIHEFVSSLWSHPEAAAAEYLKLPPNLSAEAAHILITGPHASDQATTAADIFMAIGRWDMLGVVASHLLETNDGLPENKNLAWAMALPERYETKEVFRAALDPIMSRNLVGARQWIDTLPPGWQRDLALAEYARSNIDHGDPDQYEPALNEITDPKMRDSVIQWRANLGKEQ